MRAALAEQGRKAAKFEGFLGYLSKTDLGTLQRRYVETFDLSKHHPLYLSYWTDGDTRRRGDALAAFKKVYRQTDFLTNTHGELPDFLPLVLEFAAIADPVAGRALLRQYRPSLELLRLALLAVIAGHFFGLVIPMTWTLSVGMSQDFYHLNALLVGGVAGVGTLGGILILIYRRRKTGPVFMATTRNDKVMYVVLAAAIVLGLWTTLASVFEGAHGHNYRETVAPWFRSLFILQPDIAAMAAAPFSFHIHTLVGMLLFTIWPFTRLVHAFTAPLHYLFRPYIVYRTRDQVPGAIRPIRRGWAAIGTEDRARDKK
ncbi:respiratory nitrate reductase subunit gamma [Cryobacterium lyxosi]|uniref:Respiratory nitrate reductase subunit gamma n=1 Tax=Cryobacterium lyxosi TaxID=1259228 RepID=A0A4R8ZBH1_9MICO|nr:respiratory nitrate reductase subunit gamma [Cryobacterium lyxosi]